MIKRLSAKELLSEYGDILIENEPLFQLIYYNAIKCAKRNDDETLFGIMSDNNQLRYIFNYLYPYDCVVVAYGIEDNCAYYAKLLSEFLNQRGIVIGGIHASKAFINDFNNNQLIPFVESMALDIMVIEQVKPQTQLGKMVIATIDDLKELKLMYQAFEKTCFEKSLSDEDAIDKFRAIFDNDSTKDTVFLYKVNEEIVAMAMATRKLSRGISINCVYTKENHRRQGYCKALMAEVSQHLLDLGNEYCTLFVDKNNPSSNAAYKSVGYKIVNEAYTYKRGVK